MNQTKTSFASILEPYKEIIECQLLKNIEHLGDQTILREACQYALLNGGKRFRPALVLMIAQALGYGVDVLPAAVGIEYFHTASLIADDLPCMDNDDERRNQPTVHKKYGESIALLSTYSLISAGYQCLVENSKILKQSAHPLAQESDHLCVLALENATHNTGILGATGGQLLDLLPPNYSLSTLIEIIDKKTVALFEISFVFGWIFGGGDLSLLSVVKQCSSHFGRAFQIADDLEDQEQDLNRAPNIANTLGKQAAIQMLYTEAQQFQQKLREISLYSDELEALIQMLLYQIKEKISHN